MAANINPALRVAISQYLYGRPRTIYINDIASVQVALTTEIGGMSVATVICVDPHGELGGSYNIQPMQVIQISMSSHGPLSPIFTGYIDVVSTSVVPGGARSLIIQASSPYKLWNITSQSAGDTQNIALSYMQGVNGTDVLDYSARSVGFPLKSIVIDQGAVSGAFTWGQLDTSNFISPAQQTWSSVMQDITTNNSIEFFFDEQGHAIWRRLAYLGDPNHYGKNAAYSYGNYSSSLSYDPPFLANDHVTSAYFSTSDIGTVSYVEVRFGVIPISAQVSPGMAGVWNAPPALASAFGTRRLITYIPWITRQEAADAMAAALGMRYAASVQTAAVSCIANPQFRLGTLIRVDYDTLAKQHGTPLFSVSQLGAVYYITGIEYNLTWGAEWSMVMTLKYGRPYGMSFPFLLGETKGNSPAYPLLTMSLNAADGTKSGYNPIAGTVSSFYPTSWQTSHQTTPSYIPVIITASATQTKGNVCLTSIVPNGSVLRIYNSAGEPISQYSTYVTQYIDNNVDPTLVIVHDSTTTDGEILVVQVGGSGLDTAFPSLGTSGGYPTPAQGNNAQGKGWGTPPPVVVGRGSTLAQNVLAYAETFKSIAGYSEQQSFRLNAGNAPYPTFDCSGLVWYCWNQIIQSVGGGVNLIPEANSNAQGLWDFFTGKGVLGYAGYAAALPGDLLFIAPPTGVIEHVGFCESGGINGTIYSANNAAVPLNLQVSSYPTSTYLGVDNVPVNQYLDMQSVKLSQLLKTTT